LSNRPRRKKKPPWECELTRLSGGPKTWLAAQLIEFIMHPVDRRRFLKTTLAATSMASVGSLALRAAFASEPGLNFEPEKPLIPAPSDPALWPEFRRRLADWREQRRRQLHYSDALYRREDFSWVPGSFACCFLMLCDETFYDHKTGRYTIGKFLKQSRREFGGFDSLVLWHAYPRIGFDDRNQFEFYRDVPGGIKGLRAVVTQLHHEGLKVYIDYNPWDTGTRREGKGDLDALADMVAGLDVDGIFLDTMDRGGEAFRTKLDAARKGVVLESEGALPLERVHDHHMSWAQWFADGQAPGVLRNKWFERRHMQHQIQRWDRDHTEELQAAWMNGSGMMIWENVFGSWNGWCARDRSIVRAMLPIQRRFASTFAGESWMPLVPTLLPQVYASLWEGQGVRLWTLVNRSSERRDGGLIQIERHNGERVFDLIAGQEAVPASSTTLLQRVSGFLPPRGIGCVIAGLPEALGRDFTRFLTGQRALAARAKWDPTPPVLHASLKPVQFARPRPRSALPKDMVAIPAANIRLRTEFRIRECGFYDSIHPDFTRKFPPLHVPLGFEREVTLKPYAMDVTPVTNAQFADFLRASGYKPRHSQNFLKHWTETGPPPGKEDHPVVHVALEDARLYARWCGKRLPTEEEWQYAAQGPDARKYPWGNEMRPGCCNDGKTGDTTPVRAFPDGCSPFGLYDLCGNVWEWTESERSDGHTRFCILRGGSFYQAKGSDWYADGGARPCSFAAKFLLIWPGLARCATIGFRCAIDLDR
jgi:formylglycine-generating enzyme required for sulfatase activity